MDDRSNHSRQPDSDPFDPSLNEQLLSMHDTLRHLYRNSTPGKRGFAIIWALEQMGSSRERAEVLKYAGVLLNGLSPSSRDRL